MTNFHQKMKSRTEIQDQNLYFGREERNEKWTSFTLVA